MLQNSTRLRNGCVTTYFVERGLVANMMQELPSTHGIIQLFASVHRRRLSSSSIHPLVHEMVYVARLLTACQDALVRASLPQVDTEPIKFGSVDK